MQVFLPVSWKAGLFGDRIDWTFFFLILWDFELWKEGLFFSRIFVGG